MSETVTETRAQRRERERQEAEAAASAATETPTETPTPELSEEQKAEAAAIEAIKGFSVAATLGEDGDASFAKETTPVRSRNPRQAAMDAVAQQAYNDWVAADRPTLWQNMPVITYFLDPGAEIDGKPIVPEYRRMIRKACEVITPDGDASGVRVRFGKEFPLTEKMAHKIGKPEEAGKTVLAWAAIDKRKVHATSDS